MHVKLFQNYDLPIYLSTKLGYTHVVRCFVEKFERIEAANSIYYSFALMSENKVLVVCFRAFKHMLSLIQPQQLSQLTQPHPAYAAEPASAND